MPGTAGTVRAKVRRRVHPKVQGNNNSSRGSQKAEEGGTPKAKETKERKAKEKARKEEKERRAESPGDT